MAVLPAELTRNNPSDTYALLDELVLRGGFKSVADNTERDALPSDVRKEGMLVYNVSLDSFFQLVGGVTNSDWNPWSSGGGSGDMTKAVYDPQAIEGDAFDMDNMTEGATAKILTTAERSEIAAATAHVADVTTNPHSVTKTQVGLGNVDNTSDANKPVSTATQTALNAKANSGDLATVATSGDYDDLSNKPTIPTAQGLQSVLDTGDSATLINSLTHIVSNEQTSSTGRKTSITHGPTSVVIKSDRDKSGASLEGTQISIGSTYSDIQYKDPSGNVTASLSVLSGAIRVINTQKLQLESSNPQVYTSVISDDFVTALYSDGQTLLVETNTTLAYTHFRYQRSEIQVEGDTVTLTLPASIGLSRGKTLQLNLFGSGSITLDASAVTLLDSDGVAITSRSAIDVQAAIIIKGADLTETYKIIGKYTP